MTDPRIEALSRHRAGYYYDTVSFVDRDSIDWESEANIKTIDAADRDAGYLRISEAGLTERIAAILYMEMQPSLILADRKAKDAAWDWSQQTGMRILTALKEET